MGRSESAATCAGSSRGLFSVADKLAVQHDVIEPRIERRIGFLLGLELEIAGLERKLGIAIARKRA